MPTPSSMLLAELMSRYDVVEHHSTVVHASPPAVYAAIRHADLSASWITRLLLGLRAMPDTALAFLRSPRAARARQDDHRTTRGVHLADFERWGFHIVAERAPEELVIGLLGRFWTPGGELCAELPVETFRTGPPPGQALAGWNFTVRRLDEDRTELGTETRVWCAPDARRKFRLYWFFVRPGSGLIRRAMLRAIRVRAEQG